MQKAQAKFPAIGILYRADQHLARPVLHLAMYDFTLHLCLNAAAQISNGRNARFINIAKRQMQKKPFDTGNTQLVQFGPRWLGDIAESGSGFLVRGLLQSGQLSSGCQLHHGIRFHQRTFGQGRHAHRCACRIRLLEILSHHAIHQRKITQVSQEYVELDDILQ